MANKADDPPKSAFILATVAATVVGLALNISALQFEPFALWVRIVCPLLIIVGIVGSWYSARTLWLAGWMGILLFLVCAFGMIVPGEDYISGGPAGLPLGQPNLPSANVTVTRLIFVLALTGFVIFSYARLGGPRKLVASTR
jgi:hypothetical protein